MTKGSFLNLPGPECALSYTTGNADLGKKVYDLARREFKGLAATHLQVKNCFKQQLVTLDNLVVQPTGRIVHCGQILRLLSRTLEDVSREIEEQGPAIEILSLDEHLAVVVKPCGKALAVQHTRTVERALRYLLATPSDRPDMLEAPVCVLAKEPLPKAATGLAIALRTKRARAVWNDEFHANNCKEQYMGIVHGKAFASAPEDNVIIEPLRTVSSKNTPLGYLTLVKLEHRHWKNENRHQIRDYLEARGQPLVGFAGGGSTKVCRTAKTKGLFFALTRLEFSHPIKGSTVGIDWPLPTRFTSFLDREERFCGLGGDNESKDFFGLQIYCSWEVLGPRKASETLVRAALAHLGDNGDATVLDLGTGSGCILAAILANAPVKGLALDISLPCLEAAKCNLLPYVTLGRCQILPPGSFSRFGDLVQRAIGETTQLDVIVANPPYLSLERVKEASPFSRLAKDPLLGLVSGSDKSDDLASYKMILAGLEDASSLQLLHPCCRVMVEIAHDAASRVLALFVASEMGWKQEAIWKDDRGLDRVLVFNRLA